MADRFPIRISPALSPLLRLIRVKPESAFVELGDDALTIQFGYVDASIPYRNIETVEKGPWKIICGYGLRLAPGKTMGYVSGIGDVVYLSLAEPQDLKSGPGKMSMSRERAAISIEEPDPFIEALATRLA